MKCFNALTRPLGSKSSGFGMKSKRGFPLANIRLLLLILLTVQSKKPKAALLGYRTRSNKALQLTAHSMFLK